jgi:transposase
VATAGPVAACAAGAAGRACRGGSTGLVAGDRRCLHGGGEKGGAQVARTVIGKQGSRFHLAVDRSGLPLEIRLSAGNENERRHLLPLIDRLLERGIKPRELWADRGYSSRALEDELTARGIEPRISRPRKPGQPIPAGTPVRVVWRGKKRRLKTPDPDAPQRWPVERTNAWLRNQTRIATRHDRKPEIYEAFLHLAMILILSRAF